MENLPLDDLDLNTLTAHLPYGWSPTLMYNSVGEYVEMMYPFMLRFNGRLLQIESYAQHHAIIHHLFMKPLSILTDDSLKHVCNIFI